MTSIDNDPAMKGIELQLRELISTNREQLAEMKAIAAQMQKDNAEFKAQMTKDNAEFREQMKADFQKFTEKIENRLDTFEEKVNTRFDRLEGTVGVMQNDLTGLKHDVAGLYHWDYWLLSIILVVFAMPQIVSGLKALFGVITEGIAGIAAIFRKSGSEK